jgi:hypothetical protein
MLEVFGTVALGGPVRTVLVRWLSLAMVRLSTSPAAAQRVDDSTWNARLDSARAAYDTMWASGPREFGCHHTQAGPALRRVTLQRHDKGPKYVPQVGWDACELLFALGWPDRRN